MVVLKPRLAASLPGPWDPGTRGFASCLQAKCSRAAFRSDMEGWDCSGQVPPAGVVLGAPLGRNLCSKLKGQKVAV